MRKKLDKEYITLNSRCITLNYLTSKNNDKNITLNFHFGQY